MMKHKQVLAELVEFKLVDFNKIDSLVSTLENNMIRELIINLESKSKNKVFIIVKQSQQEDLTLLAKRKFKAEVEIF